MKKFYFLFFFTLLLFSDISIYAIEEDNFSVKINAAHFIYTEDGKMKYLADAEIVDYNGDNFICQNGITAKEYDNNFFEKIQISANYAKYLLNTNEFILDKNVKIKQASTIIDCENLFFSLKKDFFFSNDYIKITNNNNVIEGTGFEGKKDLSQFLIKKINAVAKQKI